MTDSVIDRLRADGRTVDALSYVLGRRVNPRQTEAIRCLRPSAHKNGDAHPSCVVQPEAGGIACACGMREGLLGIAVARGMAADAAGAAKMLEEHFYGARAAPASSTESDQFWASFEAPAATPAAAAATNGHAAPVAVNGGPEWPWYAKTAASLGWDVFDDAGCPAMRCLTWTLDGSPGRTKIRRKKMPGRDTASFEPSEAPIGLLGMREMLLATEVGSGHTVALLAGETDLLAWTYHAKAEGIAAAGVSMATGETSRLGDYARAFHGMHVVVIYDADDCGKKEGPKRVLELLAAGAASAVSVHVPTGKDVCDYLRGGGTVRELIRLASEAKTEAAAKTDQWDMADLLAMPEPPRPEELIERLVARPSVNIVFGPPQSGKSAGLLAAMLDLCEGGGAFLGCEEIQVIARTSMRECVLWCFGSEDTLDDLRWRVTTSRASGPHREKSPERGRFVLANPGTLGVHTKPGMAWLREKILKEKPTVLVLDTVASLTGDGLDPEKAKEVGPFLKAMHALRDEFGLVIFLVHHTRKGSADPKARAGAKADSLLGAQTWRALTNTCLMFEAQDGDVKDVTIRPVKTKGVRKPYGKFRVTMRDDGRFDPLDDEEEAPKSETPHKGGWKPRVTVEAVLALRAQHPTGLDWGTAYEALGVSRSTWFVARKGVQTELLRAGHAVVGGVLRWGADTGGGRTNGGDDVLDRF